MLLLKHSFARRPKWDQTKRDRAKRDRAKWDRGSSSKLTLLLKHSFVLASARMVMIGHIHPGSASAEHSLNTLRCAAPLRARARPRPAALVAFQQRFVCFARLLACVFVACLVVCLFVCLFV
jgi:hypothetical protein